MLGTDSIKRNIITKQVTDGHSVGDFIVKENPQIVWGFKKGLPVSKK